MKVIWEMKCRKWVQKGGIRSLMNTVAKKWFPSNVEMGGWVIYRLVQIRMLSGSKKLLFVYNVECFRHYSVYKMGSQREEQLKTSLRWKLEHDVEVTKCHKSGLGNVEEWGVIERRHLLISTQFKFCSDFRVMSLWFRIPVQPLIIFEFLASERIFIWNKL